MYARTDRLAFVGIDGHIYIQPGAGLPWKQVTWSNRSLSYGCWQTDTLPDRIRHFWPTFSPRGDRLACVATLGRDGAEEGSGLYVFDLEDETQTWEIWTGQRNAPLYLSWAPDGERLAFIHQKQQALSLQLVDCATPGEGLPLVTGVPLFHRFSPDGESLLVFLGGRFNGSPGRRLYRVDLDAPDQRLTLSDRPGLFGTPAWSPDGLLLAYTIEEADTQKLCICTDNFVPRPFGQFQGHGAIAWPLEGQALLVASSRQSEQPHFDALWSYPLEGEPSCLLQDQPFVAYYPAAGGRIVLFQPEQRGQLACRVLHPDGQLHTLKRFFPSHPQELMFNFFHQYQHSHPLLSTDGTQVVFCGYGTRAELEDEQTMPHIFRVDVLEMAPAEVIADGSFVCFAPPVQLPPGRRGDLSVS